MKSNFLSLNWKDIIKGFIMAFIGSFIGAAVDLLSVVPVVWSWDIWQGAVYGAIVAALSYLLKNWLTNSNDQFTKKEPMP